ncbi:hypothetical protein ANOM_007095 [Aspergillus nomiae NRRL 13137]|uniref:Uncharacterized protein n=1 Tax=Aspergillus nomiae NRRL (strain ATCC 15546 / NRRL 13137 / CBS 260.88 / M93) TaxID=1509407 RepID=A0A0L1J0E5_ASPN3|nr:uncharacterized protein ANOM_007095 [Aspergillus nomiae NRRL 13137]KNG85125.1 hypothetical protein ANOM_007095 [Aspergillus nomiae NRRL 13137]
MATTPPPPSTLRVPPTPRHGPGYDQYEPYSTRHSARLAGQRASKERHTTPPPNFPPSQSLKGTKKQHKELGALSPPESARRSPRKKTTDRIGSFLLDGASELDDSDPFGTSEPSNSTRPLHAFRTTMSQGMLPTPAKTPKKKAVGDVGSTARTLFPPPSGRTKRSKKYTGFSLDSFDDNAQGGSDIQIYTDSRDRIPEPDESEDNPFCKKPTAPTRFSRRRAEQSKRDKEVDESVKRDDGMTYVFRGKKIFRKFVEPVESDGDDEDDDLGLLAARPDLLDEDITANVRPLTRSSIKPRVLFPAANDRAPPSNYASDVDEEAATDIEDHMVVPDVAETVDRPVDVEMKQRPVTPPPNTVDTPPSPGATIRSLRPRAKRDDSEHTTPTVPETKKKRVSPFDGWLRRKPTPVPAGSKARKRDAAETAGSPGGPATKKTRGSRAAATSS